MLLEAPRLRGEMPGQIEVLWDATNTQLNH
jgi:hypothetical protein